MVQNNMTSNIFKHLLPIDVETVVEPFGGSFVVITYFILKLININFI
ncbi:MAG: hypothetical protein ACKPKO_10365 [Candidatus Fonsibacter sp.]